MTTELFAPDKRGRTRDRERMPESNSSLRDLTIILDDRPGSLAAMGEALGRAGVSIEGGGAWVVDGRGVAHFLVTDAIAGCRALADAGIRVEAVREVLVQKLRQGEPGQLGKLTRRMADAGVNIEVLYSDHDHQLILVVDDPVKGGVVSENWMKTSATATSQSEGTHA